MAHIDTHSSNYSHNTQTSIGIKAAELSLLWWNKYLHTASDVSSISKEVEAGKRSGFRKSF